MNNPTRNEYAHKSWSRLGLSFFWPPNFFFLLTLRGGHFILYHLVQVNHITSVHANERTIMWSGNYDILNEDGKAVKVYVPNHYHNRDPSDVTISTIGGPNTLLMENESDKYLSQILHFHQEGQTWTLQAHNSFASFRTLFQDAKSPFSVNVGPGVVTCQKRFIDQSNPEPEPEPVDSDLYGVVDDDDDDWGASGEDNSTNDMDDLESKLASMETSGGPPKQQQSAKNHAKTKEQHASQPGELAWFKLSEIREPPAPRPIVDQDDVGLSNDIGNDKIQQMLAKYMEEEEDMDLVNMLRGGSSSAGNKAEPDERLSDDERALRTFVDRTNRLPRQVVRYAPTGVPLWSMYVEPL